MHSYSLTSSPLILLAHPLEASAFLDTETPPLISGIGKVNGASALTHRLAQRDFVSEILVFGTAGRVNPKLSRGEVYEVSSAVEYDAFGSPSYVLPCPQGDFPTARIATGSAFLSDPSVRDRLLEDGVDMVDMESSAYIHVAQSFSVPIRIFKLLSDDADGEADELWDKGIHSMSQRLYEAYRTVTA